MMGPLKLAVGVGLVAMAAGTILSRNIDPSQPAAQAGGKAAPGFFSGITLNRREPAAAPPAPVKAPPAPALASNGTTMTLDADSSGHYRAEAEVNGHRATMLVDTGASIIALTQEDAGAFGVRPFPSDYKIPVSTANGTLNAAEVRLNEVRVGNVLARDVAAVVMPQGALRQSLLGMSFLKKLSGFEVAQGRLVLRQ